MNKADLLALAARIEAAQGADRGLDVEIENALGLARFAPPHPFRAQVDSDRRIPAEHYTASLDAAASLVRPHWLSMARELWDEARRTGYATISIYAATGSGRRHVCDCTGIAATPALALTAAALRAMAEEAPDAGD